MGHTQYIFLDIPDIYIYDELEKFVFQNVVLLSFWIKALLHFRPETTHNEIQAWTG